MENNKALAVLAANEYKLPKPLTPRKFRNKLAKETGLQKTTIQVTTVHIQQDYWGVQMLGLYGDSQDQVAMLLVEEEAWGVTSDDALANVYKTIRDAVLEDIRAFNAGEADTFGIENAAIEEAQEVHRVIDALYSEVEEENENELSEESTEEPNREGTGDESGSNR